MNTQPANNFRSKGPYIFIVEDEPFIASMLEDMVRELGYQCSGVAHRLENALALLGNSAFKIDAAIVDIKLREEPAYELCHALSNRGIPFVFASALQPEEIEAPWRKCDNIGKPFSMKSVAEALERLLAGVTARPSLPCLEIAPMHPSP